MVSDKVNFEWAFDENHYKSCFARSVAVNSQFKQTKSPEDDPQDQHQQLHLNSSSPLIFLPQKNYPAREKVGSSASTSSRPLVPETETVKLRKNSRGNMEPDHRRASSCMSSVNSSRRTSFCSSRIAEIPIENIVHQSKVESLQWQLKETEKSREMYKAVMKQVVTFLEKTHRSLELLSNRINSSKKTVPRSKSEHQIVTDDVSSCSSTLNGTEDYTMFRDFTWRRPKKEETPPEEVPPERLSQEAFRLLRTAQSLLNTQEPKLMNPDSIDDVEFLAQLAKEFPQTPEIKPPQRTTSFSMSPKLLTPDREMRISTAFNRKLSLQFSETRKSVYTSKLNNSRDCSVLFRGSCTESEQQHHQQHAFLSSTTVNDLIKEQRRKSFSDKSVISNISSCNNNNSSNRLVFKTSNNNESEKSNSPPAGSISSVEDESGFSSMNSFQDVGLPLITDEVTAKNVLLKSMLHNDQQFTNLTNENNHHDKITNNQQDDDVKLWQKPSDNTNIQHKRWSSTPANYSNPANSTKQTMNVLWV